MALRTVALLVVALASGNPHQQAFSSPNAMLVAALQSNGALIPFAAFDGATWSASWPAAGEESGRRVADLGAVPGTWTRGTSITQPWRLWLPTGTAHAIRPDRAVYFRGVCGEQWAIITDFAATSAQCPNCCPTGTIGIATTGTRAVTAMGRASQSILRWQQVTDLMDTLRGGETAPPVIIDRSWTSGLLTNGILEYVEASRTYTESGKTGACLRKEVFQIWFRSSSRDNSGPRSISVTREAADCDHKGVQSIWPLGVITLDGVDFVLAERLGWGEHAYGVLRIGATGPTVVAMTPVR